MHAEDFGVGSGIIKKERLQCFSGVKLPKLMLIKCSVMVACVF